MAERVERLKRELKYQGTILKIYEDTVIANGHEAHWDFIHHDGAAAVLPVTDDGKILMVRQYRNALDPRFSAHTGNWKKKPATAANIWNIL